MRIQQKCDEKPTNKTTWAVILAGTVFRYGDQACGPYLRTLTGFVDLKTNEQHPAPSYEFTNYVVLPNARVVLE